MHKLYETGQMADDQLMVTDRDQQNADSARLLAATNRPQRPTEDNSAPEEGTPPGTEHLALPAEPSRGSGAADSQRTSGHEREYELAETSGQQFVDAAAADLDRLPDHIHVGHSSPAGEAEAPKTEVVAEAADEPLVVTAVAGLGDAQGAPE